MSRADEFTSLRQMLEYASEVKTLADGRTFDDLLTDRLFQLAVVRLLEIIGEAATRLSQATRDRYSTIPWRQIIGMRNRLIHAYDQVEYDVVWEVIQDDLAPFVETIRLAITEVAGGEQTN